MGAAGAPLSITFRGKTHPVSPPTAAVLDLVEKKVVELAEANVEEMAGTLSPKRVEAMRDKFDALVRKREHATGGVLWREQMEADGGQRGANLMLWACLEMARLKAADPKALPPAIKLEAVTDVLQESPDAGRVAGLIVEGFMVEAGKRRKVPASEIQRAIAEARSKAQTPEPSAAG